MATSKLKSGEVTKGHNNIKVKLATQSASIVGGVKSATNSIISEKTFFEKYIETAGLKKGLKVSLNGEKGRIIKVDKRSFVIANSKGKTHIISDAEDIVELKLDILLKGKNPEVKTYEEAVLKDSIAFRTKIYGELEGRFYDFQSVEVKSFASEIMIKVKNLKERGRGNFDRVTIEKVISSTEHYIPAEVIDAVIERILSVKKLFDEKKD